MTDTALPVETVDQGDGETTTRPSNRLANSLGAHRLRGYRGSRARIRGGV